MATKKFKAFTLDDEAKVLRFHYLFKKKMRTKPGFFYRSQLFLLKKSNFQGFFFERKRLESSQYVFHDFSRGL